MKGIFKKLGTTILAICLIVSMLPLQVFASEETKGLDVQCHTKQEIYNYVQQKNINLDLKSEYLEQPSTTQPYSPGKLTDETLNSALDTLNLMRYIAGLSDVKLSDTYNEYSQAGSLISAINGKSSYYPDKPDDMSDELYNKGYAGCNSGSISSSDYDNLNRTIVDEWMADSSNIKTVENRRWILNPTMQATGFGQVGIYKTMYINDNMYDNDENLLSTAKVAWPAQVTPIEYFDEESPWSLTIGSYISDSSDLTVKVTCKNTNEEWTLTPGKSSKGYLYVDNNIYGQQGCIIFRPSGFSCEDEMVYNVTATGEFGTVSYDVEFFKLTPDSQKLVTFDADNGTENVVKSVDVDEQLDYMPETPTKEGYTFVGWYEDTDDIATEYKSGATYIEDTTYKAKWAHVKMLGAQGKVVVDDKSGIRFGTKLYDDGDEIVEKGTLILPANLLSEGEVLTVDNKLAAKSVGKVNYEINEKENYIIYLGTIVGISRDQFDRQMTASAYVIYKDKAGNEYTVYAAYQNGSTSVNDLLAE